MNARFALPRRTLSDSLVIKVRQMIIDGSLRASERINEVRLSQKLGVSRTPLREAIAILAKEGALTSVPCVGWFVKPLSVGEFDQLYAIRPMLDPEALRLAGLPPAEQIERL
jgi:DNA-binding GntR family transcriptional regulator